jgi:hypothetical protein
VTGPLQRAAARVYGENGWPAEELDDGSGFTLYIEGSDSAWSALAITDDDAARFAFYSLSPVDAGASTLDRMAEYLHRANHGLLSATFELDHDTGEVRLRTGLEFATLPPELLADDDLLDAIVLDLSAANVGIFDRYLAGLIAVVHSNVAPADIIADIEGPIEPQVLARPDATDELR